MRLAVFFLILLFCSLGNAQSLIRDFPVGARPQIQVTNARGQVRVVAEETQNEKISLTAESPNSAVEEKDLTIKAEKGSLTINVSENAKRIDLTLRVPVRTRIRITGKDAAIELGGNLESAEVSTETGTIYAQVPTEALKVRFLWTESRPRFLSDVELSEPKEKAGGKFVVEEKSGDADSKNSKSKQQSKNTEAANETEENQDEEQSGDNKNPPDKKTKKQKPKDNTVSLDFRTQRGVILLNVPPSEVPSDLRERDLTNAAKAIIRSGDTILTDAIRKVSPRRFGDYAKTLPPYRSEPTLARRDRQQNAAAEVDSTRRLNVSVTDKTGRAVNGLTKQDFTVYEAGNEREILDVQSTSEPFNLILLLDVSGSVEERIDFIRKAARNFINATSPQDKLAVITFRDDVQVLSNFTTDKQKLSAALDTFDAGGGTALYDSLAYTLVEALKPLRGERTAVVILSDGDDNRSFIPFEPLLGTIEESGALIYPLYVPSGLIPAANVPNSAQTADPLRNRYLTLTTKAEEEARRLAEVSGGVYFPIRRLEDLQRAYEDVVAQLRTAYTITYHSKSNLSPRVIVKRENAFVRLGSSINLPPRLQSLNETPQTQQFFQKISFVNESLQDSNITGEIKQIKYKPSATESLREFPLETLDINRAPPVFVSTDGQKKIAVSRWVSPKRTRSYPYERVYNTLAYQKRAAVIPVLKDEGQSGERDFLAWDTFSLMNLLEVYIVLGYYDSATKSPRRENSLLEQKFNNEFVAAKLKELNRTNLSAFEWNLRELKNLKQILELAQIAYQKIAETTGVKLHDSSGIENFERKLNGDVVQFLEFSRQKSARAQNREIQGIQPKETVPTETKSRITISDYLGGKYFFTVDEAVFENNTLYLIESKHTQRGKLTNTSDIKDGLIKMILYRNLVDVRRSGKSVKFLPVLRLTAKEMQGAITSEAKPEELAKFVETNRFDSKQAELLKKLFTEARDNNFLVKLEQATTK